MFNNRYEAINYYKKEQIKADDDLQAWLIHYEAQKTDKVNSTMKRLKELQDLIDWNRAELKREVLQRENNKKNITEE